MTSAKVEQKRNTKIEKILDHSMQIILEEGMAALTMRNLAKRIEVTPGALYRYFSSKGDIISLLGQRILTQYTNGFEKGEQQVLQQFPAMSSELQSIVQILVINKYYWEFSIQSYGNFRLLNILMTVPHQLMTIQEKHDQFMLTSVELLQWTAKRFELAVEAQQLAKGDNFNRALGLFSILNGVLMLCKFENEYPQLVATRMVQRHALKAMLIGYGACADLVTEAFSIIDRWNPII